jgi:hypothetical protein
MEALPMLWERLERLAKELGTSDHEWASYRQSFDETDRFYAQQFHSKAIAQGWDGPFAFLIRAAATGEVGDHKDFTALSEALEDVCADYEEVFTRPLRTAYVKATRPCLVVFTHPGTYHGVVRAALSYVHRSFAGLEQGLECNANFNGRGVAVAPAWIDRVEWL